MSNRHLFLLSAAFVMGCGREAEPTDSKLAGVGLNPDEIGPEPQMYGGLVGYDWIEFSGAALPLGLVGLVSFDASGPSLGDHEQPYALVYGSAFVMDTDLPATDALFGNFGVPPAVKGECHTVFEPSSYIGGLADAGDYLELATEDGSEGFSMGRRTLNYPPNPEDVYPYYLELEVYRDTPRYFYSAPDQDTQDIALMSQEVLSRPNFPFGQQTTLDFPGAVPAETVTFSSVPVPAAAAGSSLVHQLPTRPSGVMLSWSGPQYSGDGVEIGDGDITTCMQYMPHSTAPTSPEDCITYEPMGEPADGQYPRGQMYTPPWMTDGGVTVSWVPYEGGDVDEVVSISVRFLGPLEEDSSSFIDGPGSTPRGVVEIEASADAQSAWNRAIDAGTIPAGAEIPTGRRDALPCDDPDEVKFLFDDALVKGDGYLPSLQGSPFRNLAEVSCNVADEDGSFTITEDLLADALAYGREHGATGAIFYINRTTKTPMTIPPVRDYIGNKRNTSQILVISNAASMGRFWIDTDGI